MSVGRQASRAVAEKLLQEGKREEAEMAYQRCISVTPAMVQQVIKACREHDVAYQVCSVTSYHC